MNDVRTVSDTKRAFYSSHTRPINSIYRRVVEELMVEMHLLSVNADFHYDPIYALGVVTTFDNFMEGYRPERDKQSIFNALCSGIQADPEQYRRDAETVANDVSHWSMDDFLAKAKDPEGQDSTLFSTLRAIAQAENFKYSRLFVVGLCTLLERINPDILKDEKASADAIESLSTAINISAEKAKKDVDLYRSNLDKLIQAQIVLQDMLEADRKKKAERLKAKEEQDAATPPSAPAESSQ
ncbi:MAG: photosystem II biogenesis protein Psp29 [Kaiparowitsia implicata GSE-PSE-MK54-09C]|nr:photosystem II biogenesis protein Psp29 [Kaiparowitsia implicata GSE-PSE-MK54-09C]